MNRHILVAALGIAALFGVAYLAGDHWPRVVLPTGAEKAIAGQTSLWIKAPTTIRKYQQHEPLGAYLLSGDPKPCADTASLQVEKNGTPWFIFKGKRQRHPLTVISCGVSAYNWWLSGGDGTDIVKANADLLLSMQDEKGAFRYPFEWKHYLLPQPWQPGWTSAMTQGEGLSLLLRTWNLTKDEKYLHAGKKALDYLLTPVSEGGVTTTMADLDPSLSDFIFYEEYPTHPASYTLNGFMFTLIGLYDWSKAAPPEYGKAEAAQAFAEGIRTLPHILPYYDLGKITTYDLGYITFPEKPTLVRAHYHVIHVRQLELLTRLTGNPVFLNYSRKWEKYASAPQPLKKP